MAFVNIKLFTIWQEINYATFGHNIEFSSPEAFPGAKKGESKDCINVKKINELRDRTDYKFTSALNALAEIARR
jgi:hypothetical protein